MDAARLGHRHDPEPAPHEGLIMNPFNWLFRRRAIDRDLDAEIRNHFQMAIAERIAAGEDPESARLAAINEFGNVLQTKEDARQVWRGGVVAMVIDVWQDVRFGTRMLVKNPGFSLVVIAVLSLGIAGNAAIFSLFKGLALKPLPGVRDSSQLVGGARPHHRWPRHRHFAARLSLHQGARPGVREPDRVVDDLRQLRPRRRCAADRRGAGDRQLFRGARRERATGSNAAALRRCGAGPASGRGDQRHVVAPRHSAPIPTIVGKTIYFNGQPLTVVGVAAPEFNGTVVSMGVDVFAPIMMQPQLSPPTRLDARGVFMMMTHRPSQAGRDGGGRHARRRR